MKKLFLGLLFSLWASLVYAGVSCTVPFTFVNGTTADANQVNANYAALVACLFNAAAAGNNNDITALLALTTPLTASAGGSTLYVGGTSGGSANAQTVASPVPTGFALTAGNSVAFVAGFTNTGALQLNVNSTGLKNIFRQTPSGPQAMTGGEVQSGQLVFAFYDGTQYEMVSNGPQFGGFGPLTSLSSAAPDLGTIASHNITFTGNTTITSFGSSASVTFPLYNLNFTTALTLTHNGTSLILPSTANILTASGDNAVALYLGAGNWQVISYTKANGTSVISPTPLCGFSGLSLSNGASTTVISWSFGSSVLINPTGNVPVFSTAKSGSVNTGSVGAGGLDVAGPGNNNFVYLYSIYNSSSNTWSAVGSLNPPSTGPAPMPTGYAAICYMGAMKTNGAAALYGTLISGNEARYVVGGASLATNPPLIDSGVPKGTLCTGATTYATETVRGSTGAGIWMPSTAVVGHFAINSSAGPTALAANATYTGTNGGQAFQSNATPISALASILMEGNTVFWCNTGTSSNLFQYGWKDAVNAN